MHLIRRLLKGLIQNLPEGSLGRVGMGIPGLLGAQIRIRHLSDRGESIANGCIHGYLLKFNPYILYIGDFRGKITPKTQIIRLSAEMNPLHSHSKSKNLLSYSSNLLQKPPVRSFLSLSSLPLFRQHLTQQYELHRH